MGIKKGETKYRGMNDSGREARERGDLHLQLHLHTPQQASPSQPGHHGTFPVTGGGSRPHIAVNQSDCCNLCNPHFPAGSSCTQMLCAKQGFAEKSWSTCRAYLSLKSWLYSLDTEKFGGIDAPLSRLQSTTEGWQVWNEQCVRQWLRFFLYKLLLDYLLKKERHLTFIELKNIPYHVCPKILQCSPFITPHTAFKMLL